jgi:O-antigen/teichoic acid export membrane protein
MIEESRKSRRLWPGQHGRLVVATTGVSMISLALGLLTGVLLARSLGDAGRGTYAVLAAWYAIAIVLGEWGQSAAATFRVAARWPSRSVAVASSRLVMLPPSIIVAVLGLIASPNLAKGDADLTLSYRIIFLLVALNGLLASFMYAMQSTSLYAWNMIRLSQSVAYLLCVALVALVGKLSVLGAVSCLAASIAVQLTLAYVLGRRNGLAGGHATRSDFRWLGSYGLRQSASAIPSAVGGNVDKVVLATSVSPAALGDYAVAQTVVGTSGVVGTAISAVSFPRLSSMHRYDLGRSRLEFKLLALTGVAVLVASTVLAVASPWAIPLIYGPDFEEAVSLVWWLVPLSVAQNLSLMSGTILRGRSLPGRAAWAQILGLAALLVTVGPLIAGEGVVGAALSVTLGGTVSTCAGVAFWLVDLRRAPRNYSEL